MRFSRADRSRLSEWWFTVDSVLLTAILLIVAAGMVLSLAASPAVAMKKGFDAYYFVGRHAVFSASGVLLMIMVSLLDPAAVRRLALGVFIASLVGLVAVFLTGEDINGARRWLSIGGHSIQPSEFAKPAFVVLSAWLLAEAEERPDMPALPIAVTAFALFAGLLIMQPDVGQTMLLTLVWSALFFASGQPLRRAVTILLAGSVLFLLAYQVLPYVRHRVERFFDPVPGTLSQVDRAVQSFTQGGFFGRGPGEGTIKTALPDAHTDFIFAVVAEEYGAIACLVLVMLYAFVVLRAIVRSAGEPDAATRLAVTGLALLFGLQALINMSVNVGLLPAKGMTLPFISSGGSSILAISLTLGMMLALTRRRADPFRLKKPRMMPTIGGGEFSGRAPSDHI